MLFHFYFISALRYVASYAFSAYLSAMFSPGRHSPPQDGLMSRDPGRDESASS